MLSSKLLNEWEAASNDLGLEIVAPCLVDLGNDTKVHAELLVRNFGGEKGTLIFTKTDDFWRWHETLSRLGYGISVLEEPTEPYDREIMIELLSEWGWTGDPAQKPAWVRDPEPDETEDEYS